MEELRLKQFSTYLKPRQRDSNKGNFGHVLIVGGDFGYSGAIRLAAEAALRTGAGLVSIATHPEHAKFLNASRPEIMCHGVNTEHDLAPLCDRATVIVLGPGLGRSHWSHTLYNAISKQDKPMIVDADGLNLLAEAPIKNDNWILTPHPGEAARLLKTTVQEIQADRNQAVKQLQQQFGGVAVLKGAGSLVLGPDHALAICNAGNPGMATAGMGDVLSGVLGSLVGQGIPLLVAARLGVLIHAMAGDVAAKKGERGMIASDLMPYLRQLVNL